jgi:hypothetical protein
MSLGSKAIFDALQSHAQATGLFAKVNTHEPKNAPAGSAHMAFYVAAIRPAPQTSGLASTSALVIIMARIYLPFLQEPQDAIDPLITAATDQIMEDLSADFQLGGAALAVDLLGIHGQPLDARAGYITIDKTPFRSMDITIPVIVADAFTQSP